MVNPTHPMGAEAGRVEAVVADRPTTSVGRRVEVAARVGIAGVGELEIESFVEAHWSHRLADGNGVAATLRTPPFSHACQWGRTKSGPTG
jgi:hypothetical protein